MADTSFGKYRLIAELGHGGMADVFLAVQAGPTGSGFRKLTVIKRLRQNLAEEPEFVGMLVDEARIAARLNHPNVVQTNEVGNVDAHYFIAMEYLDGQPLHRIQHRSMQRAKEGKDRIFTPAQEYVVLMDTLAGLHHAHELTDFDGTALQIVHRDMTPHNVFVTYDGQVKVVDFGIAKAVGRASETRQGVVKGKVRYMSPEQAIGQNVDRRADVFAVGVMLWEAAAGRRMWKDKDELQIVQALVAGELPGSPRDFCPDVPDGIIEICNKALALRADDRYASAEEFRLALEQYLAETGQLVDPRRKLAAAVQELFKDKRTELKSVIEKQLAKLEATGPSSSTIPALADSVRTLPSSGSVPVTVSVDDPPVATSLTNQKTTVYEKPPSRRRGLAITIGVLAVALLVSLGAWRIANSRARTTTVASAVIDEVTIHVASNTPGARVTVDDSPAQLAPLQMKVRRDDSLHQLKIEADGYDPKIEKISFVRDVTLAVELVKRDAPPPVAIKKPPPTSGAANASPAPAWKPAAKPDPKSDTKVDSKSDPKPDPGPVATTQATTQPTTPAHPPTEGSGKPRNLSLDKGDPWGNK